MCKFKGYLYAKCHVPVPMDKEEADERYRGCDLGFKTEIFLTIMKTLIFGKVKDKYIDNLLL